MALRDWLRRLAGRADASQLWPSADNEIAYAVNLSGMANDLPEALAFYRAAFASHAVQLPSCEDFRRQGDLLDKDALRGLGLRANAKLSAQFLAPLNDRGHANPLEAA